MVMRAAFSVLSPAGVRGRLSILIFHRVLREPDPLFPDELDSRQFDEMMGWLKTWFDVLPLVRAVHHLEQGTLPARAAAITFDDGYADNYTEALPILQRHGLPATFFVACGFLDGGRMWNDTVIEAVRGARIEHLDAGVAGLPTGPVRTDAEKRDLLSRLIPAVKHMVPAVRDEVVARIADVSKASLPDDLMLSTTQLRALRAADMDIGAHTVTHPILAATDDAHAEREIGEGKERLEALIGESVKLFAYPNGKPGVDYDLRHVAMVRALGFEAAVSTSWGANTMRSDPFQLLRFTPWDRHRWRFALRLVGNLWRQAPTLAC